MPIKNYSEKYRDWKPQTVFPQRLTIFDSIVLTAFTASILSLIWISYTYTGYQWNWDLLSSLIVTTHANGHYILGILLSGVIFTLKLSIWSLALALFLGGCIGSFSAHKKGPAALFVRFYINTIRNIPPLILLFFLYFFVGDMLSFENLAMKIYSLPLILQKVIALFFAPADQFDRMFTAVITLGIYEGAYITEIVRAGVETIPRSQWEASSAFGFPPLMKIRLIILPQALASIIPTLVSQSISTFKDSALAAFISLPELTFQSLEAMVISHMTFEVWIFTASVYLLLGLACSHIGKNILSHTYKWRAQR